jgi:hypothetical protein
MNCTVPVIVGPPFATGVTVAVKVTLAPATALRLDEVTATVVAILEPIVSVMEGEVEPA